MLASFFRWFLCKSKHPRKSAVTKPPLIPVESSSIQSETQLPVEPSGPTYPHEDPREPRDMPRYRSRNSSSQKAWHTPFIRLNHMHGSLMFGKYPSRKHVAILRNLGVTVFVDLTEGDETVKGVTLTPYLADKKILCPIEEKNVPDDLPPFVAMIEEVCYYLRHDENVYIHCKNGRGRSAMVMAIVLAQSASISYERAIDEINRAHRRGHGASPRWKKVVIPPHPIQRRFVRDYLRNRNLRRHS